MEHLAIMGEGSGPLFLAEPEWVTYEKILRGAEKRGLRPGVWRSTGRRNRRPTHWARAAFQSELRQRGIADSVIDALVGHAGRSVRDRHYAPATWEAQVAAVGVLPELPDGLVPKGNVVRFGQR